MEEGGWTETGTGCQIKLIFSLFSDVEVGLLACLGARLLLTSISSNALKFQQRDFTKARDDKEEARQLPIHSKSLMQL